MSKTISGPDGTGLSWRTILVERENFRAAFHDFDVAGARNGFKRPER